MSSEFHSDEADRARLKTALDQLVLKSLPTIAVVVAGLYASFAVLYWALLPKESATSLTICATITIVAMLVFHRVFRSTETSTRWTYPIASAIVAFILANHAVHVIVSPIPQQVTNTAIIIIAMGLFYLSLPWMLGTIACLLAIVTWPLVIYAPNALSGNQLYVLIGSVAVSVMVLKIRRENCIKLIRAQFELEVRRNVEQTLHSIATRLLAAGPQEVTSATEEALVEVRECTKADVSYIVQVQGRPPKLQMLYECQHNGPKVGSDAVDGILATDFPWFWNRIQEEPVFVIDNVDEMPSEAAKEQELYRATGVKAFLAVPIRTAKGLWGYLGLVSLTKPRKWRENDIRLVRTLGRNFLIAVDRQSAYQEIEDLTGRLHHASRLISAGEMSAAWFHQQKTLFQSSEQFICAAQNFLALEPPRLKEVSEVLEDLKKCCAANRETLSEFLEYTKTGETDRECWSMPALVAMAHQLTRHQAEEHEVQIELNFNHRDDQVNCSGNLIVQVIVNLVLNAVEILRNATLSEKPVIRLSVTNRDDEWVELSVIDNGPGVPPDLTETIFQRFFTTRKEGFGIGLFIGRKILESHGGRLEINANHRPGCEFILTLPLAPKSLPVDPGTNSDDDHPLDTDTGFNEESETSLVCDSDTSVDTNSKRVFELDSNIDQDYVANSDSDSDSEIAGTGSTNR